LYDYVCAGHFLSPHALIQNTAKISTTQEDLDARECLTFKLLILAHIMVMEKTNMKAELMRHLNKKLDKFQNHQGVHV